MLRKHGPGLGVQEGQSTKGHGILTITKPTFPTHLTKLLKLLYTSSINSDLVLGDCKQYYVVLSQVRYL